MKTLGELLKERVQLENQVRSATDLTPNEKEMLLKNLAKFRPIKELSRSFSSS